jgi:hypothetical protein
MPHAANDNETLDHLLSVVDDGNNVSGIDRFWKTRPCGRWHSGGIGIGELPPARRAKKRRLAIEGFLAKAKECERAVCGTSRSMIIYRWRGSLSCSLHP